MSAVGSGGYGGWLSDERRLGSLRLLPGGRKHMGWRVDSSREWEQ